MLRVPIPRMGSKQRILKWLFKHFPGPEQYELFCDLFGGCATVIVNMPPARVEIYNDLDEDVYNFFAILREEEAGGILLQMIYNTPWSRQVFNEARLNLQGECEPLLRAYYWYIMVCQSFGGSNGRSWGREIRKSNREMAATTSKWLSGMKLLPALKDRLMRIQMENMDANKLLPRVDHEKAFFYIDPPYSDNERHLYPFGYEDRERLVNYLVSNLKGMAIVSGYEHPLYDRLIEAGWRKVTLETASHLASRKGKLRGLGAAKKHAKRTEILWISPNIKTLRIFR